MVLTMTHANYKKELENELKSLENELKSKTDQRVALITERNEATYENHELWGDLRSKGWLGLLISAIGEKRNESKLRKIESKTNSDFAKYRISELGCYLVIWILQIPYRQILQIPYRLILQISYRGNRERNKIMDKPIFKIMKNFDTILSLTKEVNDCDREINRLKKDIQGINKAIELEEKKSKAQNPNKKKTGTRKARQKPQDNSDIAKTLATKAQGYAEAKEEARESPTPGPSPGREARE